MCMSHNINNAWVHNIIYSLGVNQLIEENVLYLRNPGTELSEPHVQYYMLYEMRIMLGIFSDQNKFLLCHISLSYRSE